MQKVKPNTLAVKGALLVQVAWSYLTGGCMYLTKGFNTGEACK